jgi:cytochrome c biogenesis factor
MLNHELNTVMLFIHPPLAIAGYVFIFLFTALLSFSSYREKRLTRFFGLAAWLLTFFGLISGMIWAQLEWGSYWSWDPKETSTLLLFITASISIAAYHEEKFKIAKWISLVSCLLSIVTVCISFIITGLHSFI